MNLGVTLKAAEKVFGPALPGPGNDQNTLSAVRYAAGKGKKYAGVSGVRHDAVFFIHFPTPVDWPLLTSKKGTPDFVNDLKESGPQGEQGRADKVSEFLRGYEALKQKRAAKEEVAAKKARAAQFKEEATHLRERLVHLVGEHEATLTIEDVTISLPLKITMDKKGKLKISGAL